MNSSLSLSHSVPGGSSRQALEAGDLLPFSREQMLGALQRREAILLAASFAARAFAEGDWHSHVPEVLARLGEAVDVSRIYLFDAHHETGQWRYSQKFEWVAPDVSPRIGDPKMQDFSLVEFGFHNWETLLTRGDTVQGHAKDLAPALRPQLEAQNIVSFVLVPVFSAGMCHGFLGFDECRARRDFAADEVAMLQLAADVLGAAIERARNDEMIRHSEREMRALFEAMRDAIFVINREGRYVKVVSSDPSLFFKPKEFLLHRTFDEAIGGEMAQRFHRVVDEVLDEQQMRRLEYSLIIDEREVRFGASVTPLGNDEVLWVARDITEVHHDREALRQSELLFRLLAENSSDTLSITRADETYIYISPMVERLVGYPSDEVMKQRTFELFHPDDIAPTRQALRVVAEIPGATQSAIYRARHRDGHWVWIEATCRANYNASGELEFHAISRDITERRQSEEALRAAERKYRSIFENAVEGIFQTAPDGHYIDANPSLARIYGYESAEELQRQLTDIGNQLYVDEGKREEFVSTMRDVGAVSNFESQIRRKDGSVIWISENARAVRDGDGELLLFEGTVEDITARKNAEERLLHDALHDRLTGLANRALFMDRLGQAFGRLRRHREHAFAVLFLDFDRFKNINDSLGHMAGDRLLIEMAARLSACLRPGDTISRLGGDEFAILLEDVADVAGATWVAERIQSALALPFTLSGQEVFSSASIGIAFGHNEYERPEDLLRDADMAMYRAKAMGKARHEVFDAGMHTRAVALLQLETDLRWAIERGEFRLHYQPIVSLESGRITGFEALIRWQHPERGLVAPNEFIPVAEETGWIVPMGAWVLEEAVAQLARWQNQTGVVPPLTMSVNLSSKQFSQADLIPLIEKTLLDAQVAPECLRLEITESALMDDAETVTDRLLQLRGIGVRLSLDDFGTGYSSLSYLHRFPLDTLKIDRSFIARMSEGGHRREIVNTIVTLGRNLGMDVVAEGVEDAAQLADLRALGCSLGQGYFFARPLADVTAFELLSQVPVW